MERPSKANLRVRPRGSASEDRVGELSSYRGPRDDIEISTRSGLVLHRVPSFSQSSWKPPDPHVGASLPQAVDSRDYRTDATPLGTWSSKRPGPCRGSPPVAVLLAKSRSATVLSEYQLLPSVGCRRTGRDRLARHSRRCSIESRRSLGVFPRSLSGRSVDQASLLDGRVFVTRGTMLSRPCRRHYVAGGSQRRAPRIFRPSPIRDSARRRSFSFLNREWRPSGLMSTPRPLGDG